MSYNDPAGGDHPYTGSVRNHPPATPSICDCGAPLARSNTRGTCWRCHRNSPQGRAEQQARQRAHRYRSQKRRGIDVSRSCSDCIHSLIDDHTVICTLDINRGCLGSRFAHQCAAFTDAALSTIANDKQ